MKNLSLHRSRLSLHLNHDKGCALCVAKNLGRREIPSCFFHIVSPENREGTYYFEDFAHAVLDRETDEEGD